MCCSVISWCSCRIYGLNAFRRCHPRAPACWRRCPCFLHCISCASCWSQNPIVRSVGIYVSPGLFFLFLSFLGFEDRAQPNHWTKRMASTRSATQDPRTCPRPEDNWRTGALPSSQSNLVSFFFSQPFLSFFLGFRIPNLITGLSGWRTPN